MQNNLGGINLEKPWEVNQDLTQERIIELANFIVSVREEVIEMHDEELGDTRLSLGMRAYECCRSRLIALAESEKYPWLSIITPEGRFTFCIGNTPVRFIRNDPKELPHRKLIASPEAKKKFWEQSLFPEYICENSEIRWFFVIDSYYRHPADMVYFVGYDKSKEIRSQWTVPIEERVPFLSVNDDYKPDPVDIPAPQPSFKKKTDIKTVGTNGKE
jgi:hypothetical protein